MLASVLTAPLVIGVAAQAQTRQASAAAAYSGALACATQYAESTVLDEETTRGAAAQAVVACEAQRRSAGTGLAGDLPEFGVGDAEANVEARMRIVALDTIIGRLERGDFSLHDDVGDTVGLNGPAFRYGFCITGAIDRSVARLFLGEVWFRDTVEKPRAEAEAALLELGRSDCPSSRSQYELAFEAALRGAQPDVMDIVQRRYAPTAIERTVVAPYLDQRR